VHGGDRDLIGAFPQPHLARELVAVGNAAGARTYREVAGITSDGNAVDADLDSGDSPAAGRRAVDGETVRVDLETFRWRGERDERGTGNDRCRRGLRDRGRLGVGGRWWRTCLGRWYEHSHRRAWTELAYPDH